MTQAPNKAPKPNARFLEPAFSITIQNAQAIVTASPSAPAHNANRRGSTYIANTEVMRTCT